MKLEFLIRAAFLSAPMRTHLLVIAAVATCCAASGLHYSQEGIDVVHAHDKSKYHSLKKELLAHFRKIERKDAFDGKDAEFEKKKQRLMDMFRSRARAINKSHLAERWLHQHLDDLEDDKGKTVTSPAK